MAAGLAAGFFGYAQVAGVDELDVVRILPQPAREVALSLSGGFRSVAEAGVRVGLVLGFAIFRRVGRGSSRDVGLNVASVAVHAAQADCACGVHGGSFQGRMAGQAAGGFVVGFGLWLLEKDIRRLLGEARRLRD